jgi:hypothetical protein
MQATLTILPGDDWMREIPPEEWIRTVPLADIELSEDEYEEGVYIAAGCTEAGHAALVKLFQAGLAARGDDALLHVENLDTALEALDGVFVLVCRYQKRFYGPANRESHSS